MNPPPFPSFKRFYLLLTAVVLTCTLAHARIGESQSTLESRLLKGRTAVKVPGRNQDAMLQDRSVPYKYIYDFLPEGVVHEIYYKPAEAEAAATGDLDTPGRNPFPDGWTVHVIYYKGQSVFEAYRRSGAGISRYELEGILILNKGESNWERIDPKKADPSVIGYNLKRADGKVYANRKGNTLILFDPKFDALLLEAKNEVDTEADAEAKEQAPDSLRGF